MYGQCATMALPDIRHNECKKEFTNLKHCFRKSVSKSEYCGSKNNVAHYFPKAQKNAKIIICKKIKIKIAI